MKIKFEQKRKTDVSLEASLFSGFVEIHKFTQSLFAQLQKLEVSLVTELLRSATSVDKQLQSEMQTAERVVKQRELAEKERNLEKYRSVAKEKIAENSLEIGLAVRSAEDSVATDAGTPYSPVIPALIPVQPILESLQKDLHALTEPIKTFVSH